MCDKAPVIRAILVFAWLWGMASPLALSVRGAEPKDAVVGDAYVQGSADGQKWAVGTGAVELVLDGRGGQFRVVSLKNKLTAPVYEYIPAQEAADPLRLVGKRFVERFAVQRVWNATIAPGTTADLATAGLKLPVKQGELIGFALGPHGDYSGDQTEWITTVDYGDGESYVSTQDPKVEQGPIWFYYVQIPDTGLMEPMDAVERSMNIQENIRIPSEQSGNRAPGMAPHAGPTVLHPSVAFDAVRAWRAPKDGVVTVRGTAKMVGGGVVDLKVFQMTEKPAAAAPAESAWVLENGVARRLVDGGRPVVQLDLTLRQQSLRAQYHVMAYPGTPVLRQWTELENVGTEPVGLYAHSGVFSLPINGKDAEQYTNYWMIGGNSQKNQGLLESSPVGADYHRELNALATSQYVPWMAVLRNKPAREGLLVTLDFMGNWRMALERTATGPMLLSVNVSDLLGRTLAPGGRYQLPLVTLGVFQKDLDDMGRRLYDWQYAYLWDYTHDDWYAGMQFTTAWWAYSQNLQEQFAGRLAYLNMDWSEYLRTAGMEVLWDDAGWAADPDIWRGNREGPDHAETLRYLPKMGMKWTLWFPGDPTAGIMDTKVGSWGDFQWRTDGLPLGESLDRPLREEVTGFLQKHPRCSWQTCTGGSTYAHTFEWQRFGDVHYDTDGPGSDITNFYFSYLETPDKWFDNLATWSGTGIAYDPYTGRRMLTQAPKWGLYITPEQLQQMTLIADLYHYLLQERVAGRWSYMAHPVVQGDQEHYYGQRLSFDRTKSLIVLKHKAPGEVKIFPRGLLGSQDYRVQWDSGKPETVRTGTDLMTNGIVLQDQAPGELIYLNLPNRPRSGADKTPPKAPTRALLRREVNLGFTGVGVYWSPGSDDNWISAYEVRRGEEILGRVGIGTYFFDRSARWNPQAKYAVRTVDGDGNTSPWTEATADCDEPLAYATLGGHSAEPGYNGWTAETTTEGATFAPMAWVAPAKLPSADLGGNPNQPGGAEGYWEGAETARVGRGWQQASTTACSVRTWTAPQDGTIRLLGRVVKEYFHNAKGAPLQARILHGDRKVWPEKEDWAVAPVNDLTGVQHDLTLEVKAGEKIRFVLNRGTAPPDDLLVWMPRIVYQDAAPTAGPRGVVRILCGAKQPYTDRNGNVWSEDRYFSGGAPTATRAAIEGTLPTAADQALYQSGREGKDFSYAIPVPPGLYAIRLKFAEPEYAYFFERPFDVTLNGRRVLNNMDICQSARGPRKAHERVLRYAVPDGEGKLVLRFRSGWEPLQKSDKALVQAIEVLPETKPTIRVDCGAEGEFVDWNSFLWEADRDCSEEQCLRSETPVTQAAPTLYDQRLYQTARTGRTLQYRFAVPPGLYTVHLKFAELWLSEPGQRPMDIQINGRLFWKGWDPARAAGRVGMAADLRAEDITPDQEGAIVVTVTAAGAHEAIVQGLEIE